MKIKTIRDINLKEKKVLLRLDLNVPIKNGKIIDNFKLLASLSTVRFLTRYKNKVIIISHLESDKGGSTLKPVSASLEKLLGKSIKFINGSFNADKTKKIIESLEAGSIIMLENLRINEGEKKNDKIFSKSLASVADVYVNDAFAVSHRNHASVSAIKNFLPAYAGLLLEKELFNLNKALKPKRPLIFIMGGEKISTKLPLIKKFADKGMVLTGGGLANSFLAAVKTEVGKSLIDKKEIVIAKKLLNYYNKGKTKKILLPLDVVVGLKKNGKGNLKLKKVNQISNKEIILDIGPETIKEYAKFIRHAQTIIWNGPMGMIEEVRLRQGTIAMARLVGTYSRGKAFGLAGGGETVEVLKMSEMANHVDWVSTGGGAMLSFLSGQGMPGLKGIIQ